MRQAINELVVEGYLYRKKAKGTFCIQAQDKAGFSAYLRQFRKRNEEKGLEALNQAAEYRSNQE